jgi:hypothetical protein
MGTADSGHYYSLMKDRKKSSGDDTWYEFNDTIVRPFDLEDMAEEAFGGEEKVNWSGSSNMMSSMREKYRNAYILFYERDTFYDIGFEDGEEMKLLIPPIPSETRPPAIASIMSQVKEENERYWRGRNTFSGEYFKFLMDVLKGQLTRGKMSFEMFKFFCSFYLTILVRSRDRGNTAELMCLLHTQMT